MVDLETFKDWLIAKADELELTMAQCENLTYKQVINATPAAQTHLLSQTIFKKGKRLLVQHRYRLALNELKANSSVRQEILAVFPQATFQVILSNEAPKIIINLKGVA